MTNVVIVHERLSEFGGSERVVAELQKLWPGSRVFVPFADEGVRRASGIDAPVSVSSLQRVYSGGSSYAHLLPLIPHAMRDADLDDADLVITSHHAFANRINPSHDVPTLSYVHSPARWMWDRSMLDLELASGWSRHALRAFAGTQRRPDRRAAQRIDRIVANSATVARRIDEWWGRSADVVHPPVEITFFSPDATVEREDFFLLAGRLVPYKRPELAVAAADRAGVKLIVAGEGRSIESCRSVAGAGTSFVGAVGNEDLRDLYRRCRGLVFCGVEDFGMIPVEAKACGAPVIGVSAGGLRETVVDGVTGRLVPYRTDSADQIELLSTALADHADDEFHGEVIRSNAEQFGPEAFAAGIKKVVAEMLELS